MRKKTTKEYQLDINKKYNNIIVDEDYKADNKSIYHKCTECSFRWKAIPSSVLNKDIECPRCRALRLKNEYIIKLNNKWPKINISNFNVPKDIVTATCSCGNTWNDKVSLIMFHGCSECKKIKSIGKEDIPGIFYKVLFTHNKLGFSFIKIGITEHDVLKRYRNGGYSDYSFDIIFEERTNMKDARIKELEFMKNNVDNKFYFPKDISFNGYTECYMVDELTYTYSKHLFVIRESIIINQGGICPLCENPIISPVCDHEHTGKHKGDGTIRGVICSTCNSLLGSIENAVIRSGVGLDNKLTFIKNLKAYIDKEHGTKYIYPSEIPKPKKLKKSSYNYLKRIAKKRGYTKKFPDYPKSKRLTIKLEELYNLYCIDPEYYEKGN